MEDLLTVLAEKTDPADYPYADEIDQQVPMYDATRLQGLAATAERRSTYRPNWRGRSARGPASSY